MEELLNKINTDQLGEFMLQYAEQIKYTDYNLIVLKIEESDLINENFSAIKHLKSIEYGDWVSIKNIVSESELSNIKKLFEEGLEYIMEDGEGVNDFSQIYISVLYCNEEFVWDGTTS
jgi:hypothetical protein